VAEAVGVDGATGVGVDEAEQAANRIEVEKRIVNKIKRASFISNPIKDKSLAE